MSRKNRDRRKWKCAGCGNPFDQGLAEAAKAELARLAAAQPARRFAPIVHTCAACGTMNYEEADALRPLTPAEVFELHVQVPRTMERHARDRAVSLALGVPTAVIGAD